MMRIRGDRVQGALAVVGSTKEIYTSHHDVPRMPKKRPMQERQVMVVLSWEDLWWWVSPKAAGRCVPAAVPLGVGREAVSRSIKAR